MRGGGGGGGGGGKNNTKEAFLKNQNRLTMKSKTYAQLSFQNYTPISEALTPEYKPMDLYKSFLIVFNQYLL